MATVLMGELQGHVGREQLRCGISAKQDRVSILRVGQPAQLEVMPRVIVRLETPHLITAARGPASPDAPPGAQLGRGRQKGDGDMAHHFYGYGLTISDGSQWWLSCEAELKPWLDKFSSILGLVECGRNGHPQLFFRRIKKEAGVREDRVKKSSPNKAPEKGRLVYGSNLLRIWFQENVSKVICEIAFGNLGEDSRLMEFINMENGLRPIHLHAVMKGGLLFHAALIERNGRGMLIAAEGGVGKTTCCRRFPPSWKALCDDQTLVVCPGPKEYRGHPVPTWSHYLNGFSKKTWNIEYSVPLSAIFFLRQSDQTEVVPVGRGQAIALMIQSARQIGNRFMQKLPEEGRRTIWKQVLHNAGEIAKVIPAYTLRTSLTGRFWEEMEKVLKSCQVNS